MKKELTCLGMISGVGSMMIGAKEQGYKVLGNIEWRPYYHSGTFEHNFPGAFMAKTIDDLTDEQIAECTGVDLLIGHTECGNFSNLRMHKVEGDIGDIPEFIEAIQLLEPNTFAMDNLPKSLTDANWKYWADNLPDYDIHFEWISNYNYGNIQKHRKRLFVIGAKKELGFYFIPGEFDHSESIRQRIEKIDPLSRNQTPLAGDAVYPSWGRYLFDPEFCDKSVEENRLTLDDFRECIRSMPNNQCFPVYNKRGELKRKIGFMKVDIDKHAPVLNGGGCVGDTAFRSDNCMPFSIRERAKIQGCPDDFVFFPEDPNGSRKEYMSLIKQTGKFMPVEFCTYLTQYIKNFLDGIPMANILSCSGKRKLKPYPLIDQNKQAYCFNVGYTNQVRACKYCGSKAGCTVQEDLKNISDLY